jgi:tetratricopeptide (TPR) repeat protein
MMDRLDKTSIAAIAVLAIATISMLSNREISKRVHGHNPGSEDEGGKNSYALQIEMDKKIYKEVASYQKQGLYAEAMAKLEDVMKKYPQRPRSHVYMAQLHLKQGELAIAIHEYRRAVEMEPDYVDERTPLFIGNEIKELVVEAREKFGREKKLRPQDKTVKIALNDVYYLQSRLAGGCE